MPDTMTLTPIGVGFAYGRPGEAQSAYLVTGEGCAVCLDLGSGTLNRLQAHIAPETLDALVVSHGHADHCVDLISLRVYMMIGPGRGRRLRLILPSGLRARLEAFAGRQGWDDAFSFEELDPRVELEVAPGWRLSCTEVPHMPPSYALRIDRGRASLTYGGDCAPNDTLPVLASGTDVLIAECTEGMGPRMDGLAHLSAADAGAMARAAGARRLLLTHCAPEHDRDAALRAAREVFGGEVDWARQGEAVVISSH